MGEFMLAKNLSAVIKRLAQVPDDAQDEMATLIEAWLSDRQWDALLEDPRGDAFVAQLMTAAAAGPYYPWPGDE
jgi:predicted negative regulator of RcsB-dependent stress response